MSKLEPVTLGALYCSARLRLSREQGGKARQGKAALVLLQLTFLPPYRLTQKVVHTEPRHEATDGMGHALRWCSRAANELFN
uniref:Uncharacterized protein n=1 Tax=Vespula pensylvanica TaxID=30213 RepID=A0A834P7C0_VESPE|nr:hypothetical protein H0235_004413 [Vespula pensylvanica]